MRYYFSFMLMEIMFWQLNVPIVEVLIEILHAGNNDISLTDPQKQV